ncbi:MAG: [FeFe] hydrogenase H-cluster radical SAM maturase HydE, partial [Desulfovibrio sp.]|nr:[FeFe] hydrogenase H-cluster radical SAM maturase HydE [Desulfovibrio sp.]
GAQLSEAEFEELIGHEAQLGLEARARAGELAVRRFGRAVHFRAIVEFTSHCRQDCRYCGLRRENSRAHRYRMSEEAVLACCQKAYSLGIRTFVLQGGEDPFFTDARIVRMVQALRSAFPDAAVTLSLGERSEEDYRKFFEAGASRYLLRHETADPAHYRQLHGAGQSYWNRMACLHQLKAIGFQTGCGMIVGTPWQTAATLARDLAFMQAFQPHMIGIGPFLPATGTPFAGMPPGDADLTLYLLALCRLMLPDVLLPATTALRTLSPDGCRQGLLAGCNVLMPNFTQAEFKADYAIYDGKPSAPGADSLASLQAETVRLGFHPSQGRGDWSPSPDGPSTTSSSTRGDHDA